MNRTTIDFGIDLGTTNSAVAVLKGTIQQVIKNNIDADITPSAVFEGKANNLKVGQRAKSMLLDDADSTTEVFVEFKRRMGSDYEYHFGTGRIMKAEDLSAEVLKSLRGDVQRTLGEDIRAAVITVPAAFENRQCAATTKAAHLAGFDTCPLLQEPVAAALAYGFDKFSEKKAYWLVYDFGGGTFDAAIINVEDGSINVVNQGGDNYLGGSDIDWAILEQLIIPKLAKEHSLSDFTRGNAQWKSRFPKLKYLAEQAKIELTASNSTMFEGKFPDLSGKSVEFELPLTRAEVVRVAEPIIMRSIEISKRVLKEKGLTSSDIQKVILVGGPTKAPYFREILQTTLNIALEHNVDPLTVVARGAAVFAGTQRLVRKVSPVAVAGQFNVDLKYKSVGADTDPNVRGEVTSPSQISVEGFTVELVNDNTHWRSGKITLRANGLWKTNLLAEKGCQNVYKIELCDATGVRQIVVPDTLTYTMGIGISEQPLCNSIGVALANNAVFRYFNKGDALPSKATHPFRSTHVLHQGQSGEVVNVPVVEGENDAADRNVLQGHLKINGNAIKRDLPAGSEIEVTIHIDASRIIRAEAYVPMLDEVFDALIVDQNTRIPNATDLDKGHKAELQRLNDLRAKAEKAADDKARKALKEVTDSPLAKELNDGVAAAKADHDAAAKVEKQLLELKIKLDEVEDSLKWPALVAEVEQWIGFMRTRVGQHGGSNLLERANRLEAETREVIKSNDSHRLRKKHDQIIELWQEAIRENKAYWVSIFQQQQNDKSKFRDPTVATRIINQGQHCLTNNDLDGLRAVVFQLWALLPPEIEAQMRRGYESGLVQ